MLDSTERKQIIALMQREVVPAIGCTEPVAVALCVAKATETLGCLPEHITLYLSANILKNAMGVGIPGTGMIGLPIATALGALVGKSDYQLEVLKDSNPDAVEKGKQYIAEKRITILLKENITEKLYIEAICEAAGHTAKAIIAGGHTNFVYVAKDDTVLLDKQSATQTEGEAKDVQLSFKKVYEFATTTPLEELEFILEAKRLNMAAAEFSLKGDYGHGIGRMMCSKQEHEIMGDSVYSRILSYTSAACDARMGGAMIPVMSNSGSGNQGITATLPVVVFAQENHKSHEELVRALALSNLIAVHQKRYIGPLSAFCGAVNAATGAAAGICFLLGGSDEEISRTITDVLANVGGIVCDGAKPSCAAKISSALEAAILSYEMTKEGNCFKGGEGLVNSDIEKTIESFGRVGREGMKETDAEILKIMLDN